MTPRLSPLTVLITIGLAVGPITVRADAWRDYARSAMTPDYAWANDAKSAAPSARNPLTNTLANAVRAEFRTALHSDVLELRFSESRGNDIAAASVASLSLFDSASPGLNRQFADAQLVHACV